MFKNEVSKQVVALEQRPGGVQFADLRDLVSGARGKVVYDIGDPEYGIWSAGISMGLINNIPTCEALLTRIENEAEGIIERMRKQVHVRPKL